MKFTGEIRIPEVDHPGIPASILVEDTQIEVVLDGESLGRWSLVDVRARRLISSAFQLELDGEELTFIADEPMDFAYRGVEQMGEVWARINSLGPLKRTLAVRRSRSGIKPSRIGELRTAMEANLKVERRGFLGRAAEAASREPSAPPEQVTPSPESMIRESEPAIPDIGETSGDDTVRIAAEQAEKDRAATRQAEEGHLAEERAKLEEERARLQGERERLEELRREAEERDAQRIEAFRMEMARLEAERAEHERVEAERASTFKSEMAKLQNEREQLEKMESERSLRAGEDAARADALKDEMARLERERREMEQAEAERVAAAQAEQDAVNARRAELEQMEADRIERERVEAERIAELDAERVATERAELELIAAEQEARERAEADEAQAESARIAELGRVVAEESTDEDPGMAKEVLGTSASSDDGPGSARELVVDLGVYEDPTVAPEPVLATAAREKAGFMGAVRSALTRGGRSHEHEFVEAPGGLGIARSICRECGYVSISATD